MTPGTRPRPSRFPRRSGLRGSRNMRVICERPRNQTLHARAGRGLAAILRAVGSADRDQRPFNCSARGDRNITYSVCQPSCVRWLRGKQRDRGSASKILYSLSREVPRLRRAQAEFFHAQAPDWQLLEETHRIERGFGFAISGRRLPLFSRLRGAIQTVCAVNAKFPPLGRQRVAFSEGPPTPSLSAAAAAHI